MTQNLNRLTTLLLLLFFVAALSLFYWSVPASDDMLRRLDNPRRVEAEQGLRRGALFARDGTLLAESVPGGTSFSGKSILRRVYPQPAAISAVGYYSLVHGVGGAEEAYDATLRGDDRLNAGDRLLNDMLHRAQQGSDVRLTLDLKLEAAFADALRGQRGAAVAIEVPSGAVRAMVSAPTFDPNALDRHFDEMLKAQDAPLLNRITQGLYQPGGALQPILLSVLLTKGAKLADPAFGADAPLTIGNLTLTCSPAQPVQTLVDVFAAACPAPFAEAVTQYRADVQTAFDGFGLTHAPTLLNFRTVSGPPSPPLYALANDPDLLRAQGTGQGTLTVTPLQIALAAASIANHGTGIAAPFLADAVRAPGGDWVPIRIPDLTTATLPREVADQVRVAMRAAVTNGAANAAAVDGLMVYGHASYALSGQQSPGTLNTGAVAWFVGFAESADGKVLAVAVVLAGTADIARPARVAGAGFRAFWSLP